MFPRFVFLPFKHKRNLILSLIFLVSSYFFVLFIFKRPNSSSPISSAAFSIPVDEPTLSPLASSPANVPSSSSSPPSHPCGAPSPCATPLLPFRIATGHGAKRGPEICVDGVDFISPEKRNFGRGLNVLVLDHRFRFGNKKSNSDHNNSNITVNHSIAIRVFDTYLESSTLLRFLKYEATPESVLIFASFDEASQALDEDVKRWLSLYGAAAIERLSFRGTYLFVGQRGLSPDKSVEAVRNPRNRDRFARQLVVHGCLKIPMGPLKFVPLPPPRVIHGDAVNFGAAPANCGAHRGGCGNDHFSLSVYSGRDMRDEPRVCIDGRGVMAKGLNSAGRGLNLVVVKRSAEGLARVIRLARFDTYAEDSSELELFLESLVEGEILVAVTFDDASRKLSDAARVLLNELGAGNSQNIGHRDAWYFVGQKGIKGFTLFEELLFSSPSGRHPPPIDRALCSPFRLPSRPVVPDPTPADFRRRRNFCAVHAGYESELCDPRRLDEAVPTPPPIDNPTLFRHPIFFVPIFVFAADSPQCLQRTIATLMTQSGLRSEMVIVMTPKRREDEIVPLARVYGLRVETFEDDDAEADDPASSLMRRGVDRGFREFTAAKLAFVLEAGAILSPDFLYFASQLSTTFESDESLVALSAWNPNGYETPSLVGDPSLIHRGSGAPGVAFLLKRRFWEDEVIEDWKRCCAGRRTWRGWALSGAAASKEMVFPDVSRVFLEPFSTKDAALNEKPLRRKRRTNRIPVTKPSDTEAVEAVEYERRLEKDFANAEFLDGRSEGLKMCADSAANESLVSESPNFPAPNFAKSASKRFVIPASQSFVDDHRSLRCLARCFGILVDEDLPILGLHNGGVLRISFRGKRVMIVLVGFASRYGIYMKEGVKPFELRNSGKRS